jgi:hypothetical protein
MTEGLTRFESAEKRCKLLLRKHSWGGALQEVEKSTACKAGLSIIHTTVFLLQTMKVIAAVARQTLASK